jgi:hypothetical protein
MVSFEFGETVSGGYAARVGQQPLTVTAVPNQPTRLYFVGASQAQATSALIELMAQPEGATVFSETYTVPACRPPEAAQPKCPPPEFFDPVMDRCRIVGNEQPDEAQPSDDYTPPGD